MAESTQLAYRTLKGIGIFNAAPEYSPLEAFQRPEGNLRCCCYSPDGRFFAWASPEQVSVVDAAAGNVITSLPAENVYELGFSPIGTYIITWQRPTKDEEGNATKNLKVWRTLDENAGAEGQRSVVGEFVQRNQTGWNLQYTADEKFCARLVTNEIQFYECGDLKTVWNKLRVEGVADFAVSPGKNPSVAVFVPERKGQPAAVKVYGIPQFASPVSQKTFFKGDKVQFKWNDLGTGLIVLAQTDVDKTNKSYYGETTMYLLSAHGGFDARIDLDKDGPIHEVAWSPNSKEFGVVYGYMPAKTTIFNARAKVMHSFPLSPRNTILFSPHGRFVLVAGFGNLAGQMDVYDLSKNFSKIVTIEASNASVCEWSPDGQHILTATTSPRLRVDNGVRIWHASGPLMYYEEMQELYHVCWRPQNTENFSVEKALTSVPTPHASAANYMATKKASAKPAGAYRPPGARGTSTPLHFKREDEGGAAYVNSGISSNSGTFGANGFGSKARRHVPGADPVEQNLPPGAAPGGGVSLAGTGEGADEGLSKAALKNRKKREAKKAREQAEMMQAAGLKPDGLDANPNRSSSPSRHAGRSPERRGKNHERSRSGDLRGGATPVKKRASSRSREGGFNGAPPPGLGPAKASQLPEAIETNAAQSMSEPPDLTVTSPGGGAVPPGERRMRGLLKKLRAIDDLKARQTAGEKLEDTQVRKIESAKDIKKQLEVLGWDGQM
ncbi:eukaryotic translation initiation factor-like protein subunit eIF2A [Aulographum hederae CBS 113979]|uniref:Eukaryotic translation initiation factor 2A n=1 Tax=Aulographum hederae CBS 113979 TaxID=1176131 RepID=A0A6G1H508_9PEZI|nr:eukaryotic translation initiation factor-like protein subunit eIF2A [Aulographum hederae CBS 113979]